MPPLSGGSPRRLYWEGDKWVLEVVRHVNIGHDLIRPTTERIEGRRRIISYFDVNHDKASLGRSAARLIGTEASGPPRSYSAVGGEWVLESLPPGPRRSMPARSVASLELELAELEARVVALTAVQEGLLARLARLEARLAEGAVVLPASSRVDGGRFGDEAHATDQDDRAAGAAFDSDGEAAGDSAAGHDSAGHAGVFEQHEGAPPEVDTPAELEAREGAPDGSAEPEAPVAPREQLALPPIGDLARCLALLIGGDVSADEAEPLALNRLTKDCYATPLLSDTDEVLGLIVMDLRATVFLGGTLMMLPRTELEQQLKQFSPGEDSVAASAEVCNALSGVINDTQNIHVRTGPLQKFEIKAWEWVAEAADRRDLQDSFGGRTAVLARAT